MTWINIKTLFPPELKTPDGIGTRKSEKLLVLFETPDLEFTEKYAVYDFLKSVWIAPDKEATFIDTPKFWFKQNNFMPKSVLGNQRTSKQQPLDKQRVLLTTSDGETYYATYNLQEDLFIRRANIDWGDNGDFVYRQFISGWMPVKS